ncbi:MAG TPA: ADP-ribosylglycohydrolase family protein [Cyclobacteriaceae bacterium]|nr:ADP-ribosylglycohydrolase family protein [Cyclobacteriaceae bacterium]
MAGTYFKIFYFSIIIFFHANNLYSQNKEDREYIYLTAEEVSDRIRGGLLGQMLGNLNGIPHEFKYFDEPGNVTSYIPSLPDGARTDDDTDFEWVYILEMQKKRNPLLSSDDIFNLWKERINRRIWCSNRFARYLMDIGIKPPFTGYSALNPWADFNISGQFLCETFGLISPAMPQTAAKIGLNYTTTAINNEPAQATQFFTAMISYAFINENVPDIINAGISALDSKSKLNGISRDVMEWYSRYPLNWRETRRLLKEKYTVEGGNIRDNNGFELNTGSIIAALLYGQGDFQESLKVAFNFGWDADCNAATVGTILGVRYGYRKMMSHNDPNAPDWLIVDRYKNSNRDNMPMDETITSFADRLIELFEMINGNNGGERTIYGQKLTYKIPVEDPVPVIRLTSFHEQKNILLENTGNRVDKLLFSKERDERARAAYLAICLELNKSLAGQYPKEWKQASYDLSGYWKIMNNIFEAGDGKNEFSALKALRAKFEAAGFRAPVKSYEDEELYHDLNTWRNPESNNK